MKRSKTNTLEEAKNGLCELGSMSADPMSRYLSAEMPHPLSDLRELSTNAFAHGLAPVVDGEFVERIVSEILASGSDRR